MHKEVIVDEKYLLDVDADDDYDDNILSFIESAEGPPAFSRATTTKPHRATTGDTDRKTSMATNRSPLALCCPPTGFSAGAPSGRLCWLTNRTKSKILQSGCSTLLWSTLVSSYQVSG